MNIWIINHYAIPPDTAGSTRHFDFARELVQKGQMVTIFAAGFNHRTKKEERLEKRQNYRRERIDGVEFIWIRTYPYQKNDWRRVVNMLSYTLRVIPLGIRLKETPEVVLASSPHPFAGLAGYILAKLKGARFILEVRDLWPETFVGIGGYSQKSLVVKLLRVLEKFLYQRAKRIVVLLPQASEYITRLGIPDNKIVYIPNCVSSELFANTSVRLPEELDKLISRLKAERKVVVGYAGAHGIANILDTIVEAAKLLQERGVAKIHFLLVGDGPEKERLMTKAVRWQLSNISFHNSIPKDAIPRLLRFIDIAVMSMRESGLYRYGMSANKVFDYMACARPVVWSTNLAYNPIAEAGCGITVPAGDAVGMAGGIMELFDLSDHERQDMGARGYDYVMKNHSVSVLASKLLEVLKH